MGVAGDKIEIRSNSDFTSSARVLQYLFILKIFDLLITTGGVSNKKAFEKQLLSGLELSKNGMVGFVRLQLLINTWLRHENKSLNFQNNSER